MLGPARVRLNVRTRNKKHRKKPFKTLFESEDSGMTIVHVLPHELPAYFVYHALMSRDFSLIEAQMMKCPLSNGGHMVSILIQKQCTINFIESLAKDNSAS